MAKTNYSVAILETSKEITAKERVALKDTSNAIKLDEVVALDKPFVFKPEFYAILEIHNEASEDKEYKNYVIVDDGGNKYATGSESFFDSFIDIYSEMDGTGEEYAIEVRKVESKNYKGKTFLTCSIV